MQGICTLTDVRQEELKLIRLYNSCVIRGVNYGVTKELLERMERYLSMDWYPQNQNHVQALRKHYENCKADYELYNKKEDKHG